MRKRFFGLLFIVFCTFALSEQPAIIISGNKTTAKAKINFFNSNAPFLKKTPESKLGRKRL